MSRPIINGKNKRAETTKPALRTAQRKMSPFYFVGQSPAALREIESTDLFEPTEGFNDQVQVRAFDRKDYAQKQCGRTTAEEIANGCTICWEADQVMDIISAGDRREIRMTPVHITPEDTPVKIIQHGTDSIIETIIFEDK